MAEKVSIGTIKVFDENKKHGVIVPRDISEQIGEQPVYFKAPQRSPFRVGQLVQYVVDENSDRMAKDVAVLSESA